MKKKTILFICIVVFFIVIYVPARASAFPGSQLPGKVVQGVVWTAKGIGKTIYWTVKGTYIITEYFVVEAFRPVTAVTQKMVDIWGVPVEE